MRLICKPLYHNAGGLLNPDYILNPSVGTRTFRSLFVALRDIDIPTPKKPEMEVVMTVVPEINENKPLAEYSGEERVGYLWLYNTKEDVIVPVIAVSLFDLLETLLREGPEAIVSFILIKIEESLKVVVPTLGKSTVKNGGSEQRTKKLCDTALAFMFVVRDGQIVG